MPFVFENLIENNIKINVEGNSCIKLMQYMDNDKLKYSPTADEKDSVVSERVQFFLRSYTGNKVIKDVKNNTCIFEKKLSTIPEGATYNDYVLIVARELMCDLFSPEDMLLVPYVHEKIALSSFPIPFGFYKDESGEEIALVQFCVDHEKLNEFSKEGFEYMDVEETDLLKFLEDNISDVKFKFTKEEN